MTEDPLFQATRALRELTASEEDGRRTRAAILSQLPKREARRLRPLLWLPIAALLIGSTALAASQGKLSGLVEAIRATLGGAPTEAPGPSPRHPHAGAKGAPVPSHHAPELPPEHPTQVETEPEPVTDPSPTAHTPAASASTPSTQRPSQAASPVLEEHAASALNQPPSPALDAYRAAHELHFQAQDWAAALAAWSRYLELAPNGPLAPEARFNRGLCWIRTGDPASARAALTPFAEGHFGGYRQAEAARLLAALGRKE
jgi:TolA-binding protein